MAASQSDLYKAHVKNLRAVDHALRKIFRELNASLARRDDGSADALLKTAMLLLGAWAENRLRKLMLEPNGFTQPQQAQVDAPNSQIDKWKKALEVGFRKRYGVANAELGVALPLTPRSQYQALLDVINKDLEPLISVRNKLAHGQWARPLNNENTDFSSPMIVKIRSENAHSVKCKLRMLEHMAKLVHDLVAGNHAFQRDFDKHYHLFETARREISLRSYDAWLIGMRAKFDRGREKREAKTRQWRLSVYKSWSSWFAQRKYAK